METNQGSQTQTADTGVQDVSESAQQVFEPNPNNVETSQSASTTESNRGGEQRQETQQPAQPNAVTMTNEQLQALAKTMVSSMPQPQVPQPQPQGPITPEQQAEFDRYFGVVRLTPEMFTKILGQAPQDMNQVKELENLLHGIARQAINMSTYQVNQELAKREQQLMQRFDPVASYVRQQQASALENEFFTTNPDLKDFSGLVAEVTAAATAQKLSFPTKEKAIDYVATRVRDYLNKARGGTPPPNRQSGARKTMPAMSMGGRTGSTNGSQHSVSGPQSVFGDLDS